MNKCTIQNQPCGSFAVNIDRAETGGGGMCDTCYYLTRLLVVLHSMGIALEHNPWESYRQDHRVELDTIIDKIGK